MHENRSADPQNKVSVVVQFFKGLEMARDLRCLQQAAGLLEYLISRQHRGILNRLIEGLEISSETSSSDCVRYIWLRSRACLGAPP